MSYSLSGDIIICSSDTELDCQGRLDRRRPDELCVRACMCVVCLLLWGGLPVSGIVQDGGASLTVSVILTRCHQCQDDTATTCVCAHVRRWRLKSSCRSRDSPFSLRTNPIPLWSCQFQVFSLWIAAPADFNKTN